MRQGDVSTRCPGHDLAHGEVNSETDANNCHQHKQLVKQHLRVEHDVQVWRCTEVPSGCGHAPSHPQHNCDHEADTSEEQSFQVNQCSSSPGGASVRMWKDRCSQ
jgi:hypothetical protein